MRNAIALSGIVILLAACDGGSAGVTRDAGARRSGHGRDAGTSANDAAVPDALPDASPAGDAGHDASFDGPPQPMNLSFETALAVTPDAPPTLEDVTSATQTDYFMFEGKAGEFYALQTDTNSFSPDNVMSFFDSDHTLLAQNDNGSIWSNDTIDSRLVVRLPRDGTYYVALHDPGLDEAYFTDNPFPLAYFHFSVRSLQGDAPGFAHAQSNASVDVPFQTDMVSGYAYATLVGEFGSDDSRFAITGADDRILVGQVLQDGLPGNGSSARFAALRVSGRDTHHAFAAIEAVHGQAKFHPPMADGQYELTLGADHSAELGDNPFYAIDIVLLPDNPREQADTENDVLSGAESVEQKGMYSRRGLLLSTLPEHDVDYYRFEARDKEAAVLACEGQSGGSGVRGLHVELRDANDEVLAAVDETEDKNASTDVVKLPGAGTYYVRLSSSGVASDGGDQTEPWVRCAVLTGPG